MRTLNNNVVRRLFGTINTKKISPCISCKNYNVEDKTCRVFCDYDITTEKKIYHNATIVRNDNSKCGLEKMEFYEPILNDLLDEYEKNKYKKMFYSNVLSLSFPTLFLSCVILPKGIIFWIGIYLYIDTFDFPKKIIVMEQTEKKLKDRIDAC